MDMIEELSDWIQALPKGSTIRLDNDSWEALLPGWEEGGKAAEGMEHPLCREHPHETLIPALLLALGLECDRS